MMLKLRDYVICTKYDAGRWKVGRLVVCGMKEVFEVVFLRWECEEKMIWRFSQLEVERDDFLWRKDRGNVPYLGRVLFISSFWAPCFKTFSRF